MLAGRGSSSHLTERNGTIGEEGWKPWPCMMAAEIPIQPGWPWLSFLHYLRVKQAPGMISQGFLVTSWHS